MTTNFEEQANERVKNSDTLIRYSEIIFDDWNNWDEHMEWIATAPESEIIDWAMEIRWNIIADKVINN